MGLTGICRLQWLSRTVGFRGVSIHSRSELAFFVFGSWLGLASEDFGHPCWGGVLFGCGANSAVFSGHSLAHRAADSRLRWGLGLWGSRSRLLCQSGVAQVAEPFSLGVRVFVRCGVLSVSVFRVGGKFGVRWQLKLLALASWQGRVAERGWRCLTLGVRGGFNSASRRRLATEQIGHCQ